MSLKKLKFLFSFSGFLSALYFSIPIWMVFLMTKQHFSLETAIRLSMLEGVIIAIFEVWSGSWSDRFGRRKIFALGGIFQMIATIIYIFGQGLPIFIISAIVAGIGGAMMSGNVEAIVHDNLAKLSEESQFSTLQSQSYMWLFIGRTFGAISGGYLFVINPTFPYIGNLAIFILYTTTIFFFPKDEQVKSSVKNDFEHIVIGLRDLGKNKSTIIMLFLVILASSIGNIYWFTYQEYFRLLGLSLESFGWFYALTSAVSGIAAWILGKCIEKKISQKILLSIIIGLLMISSFLFAFHQELWSLFGLVSLSFMFGWIMTLGNTLILTSVASTHKSFAISAFSFAMTLGYASFTFMAGFFIERYGLGEVYRYIAVSLLGIGILGCIMLFSVAKK